MDTPVKPECHPLLAHGKTEFTNAGTWLPIGNPVNSINIFNKTGWWNVFINSVYFANVAKIDFKGSSNKNILIKINHKSRIILRVKLQNFKKLAIFV